MPIGFIILGVFLIYLLMFEHNKTKKIIYSVFFIATMLGYIIKPLSLKNVSINIMFFVASLYGIIILLKNYNKSKIFNFILLNLIVGVVYVVLIQINSEFVVTINPYPICFLIILLSALNLNDFKYVISFNLSCFLNISICNLIFEKWLNYIHFANLEFFNLIVIILAIMLLIKLFINNFNLLKRSKQ